MNQKICIQPLTEISYQQWMPLWEAYQSFYAVQLSDEINQSTWQRLSQPKYEQMYGFAALINQEVVGIVHVVEHESCWTIQPYAYLQDLYTVENLRGRGIARQLIEQVRIYTQQRQCDRVYWLTHQNNQIAQQLYDRVAKKTGFIQYRMD